jgi:hypothetical protein
MRRKHWIALGVVLVLALAAGLLLPALQPAREIGTPARCPSMLKQIGYGCHLYASDYDDKFPPGLGHLYPDIISDGKVFLCPSAGTALALEVDLAAAALRQYRPAMFKESHTDYVYVAGLTAKDPKDLVLAHDRDGNHEGHRNVLFVGGNVEWMKEEDFCTALGKTQEFLKVRGSGGAR